MAKYDIANEAKGARFIGSLLVEAGETLLAVELTENEALAFGDFEGVAVKEAKTEKAAKADTETK